MQSEYRLETWSEYFTRKLEMYRTLEAFAQRIKERKITATNKPSTKRRKAAASHIG